MKNTEELNVLPKPHTTLKTNLQCSLIIALCFLWTATGHLSWMYHLLDFAESSSVDLLTEVIGYLFQAFGHNFIITTRRFLHVTGKDQ